MQTCDRLAPDTKILDLHMRNREMILVDVNKVFDEYGEEGIKLDIPRTNDSETGMPRKTPNLQLFSPDLMLGCYFTAPHVWNVTTHANLRRLPMMHFEINISKADSSINIELFPQDITDDNLTLLMDFQRIPTYKKYDAGVSAKDLQWNSKGGGLVRISF